MSFKMTILIILTLISIFIVVKHNIWFPVLSETKRSKKYYKLLHKNEIHKGFKYNDNYNEDIEKVSWYNNKGLHFIDKKHLRLYYDSEKHVFIREVLVPKDAKFFQKPGEYKANKIIMGPKKRIENARFWLEYRGIDL